MLLTIIIIHKLCGEGEIATRSAVRRDIYIYISSVNVTEIKHVENGLSSWREECLEPLLEEDRLYR